MTTILVHGAWHGAWSWERVAPLLDGEVRTPTLMGLGERAAEASEAVDLETHTADVVRALGDAHDVTLVAHSYAGFVVAGVVAQFLTEANRIGIEIDSTIGEINSKLQG